MQYPSLSNVRYEIRSRLVSGEIASVAIDAISDTTRSILHTHENSAIRRDVKPHNVLIATESTLKMTGFGITRIEYGISSGLT